MTIGVNIKDGKGRGNELSVSDDGSAKVTVTGVPPEHMEVTLRPYTAFMLDSSESKDMRVVGTSVNYKDFVISSTTDADRYIHTLAITLADAGCTLKKFGSITELINGCQLLYNDPLLGNVILGDELKSNFDFVQMCNFEPFFGSGADAFRAKDVEGTSEAYIPLLDIEDVYGMQYGIKIPKGSEVKLVLRVRDDTSTIDRFDIKAFGYDRVKHTDILTDS